MKKVSFSYTCVSLTLIRGALIFLWFLPLVGKQSSIIEPNLFVKRFLEQKQARSN